MLSILTRRSIGAALAATALFGCSPSPPPPEGSQDADSTMASCRQTDPGLHFEIIPNDLGKVDLIRQTTTESDTDSDGNTTTRTVDVPLSPFGVYLGRGLFYDFHHNLSFVPYRYCHGPVIPPDAPRVMITEFGPDTVVTRNGSQVTVSPNFPLSQTTVTEGSGQVFIDPTGPGDTPITRHENTIVIDPWGPLNDVRVTDQGNTIVVEPRGYWSTVTLRFTGATVTVERPGWGSSNDSQVTFQGNRIGIDNPGWNDSTVTIDENAIRNDGPAWMRSEVRRDGNVINIIRKAAPDSTIQVER